MSTVLTAVPVATSRPRPRPTPVTGPTYRVAPPVADGFAPWVAVLEEADSVGPLRWIVGPEGVLLPTRLGADADRTRRPGDAVRRALAVVRRR
jgi:hypothetical protein